MEAKEPRWKAKALDTTGRGQIFMVSTFREPWGRFEPERDLIPVAAWGGGGWSLGGEKG